MKDRLLRSINRESRKVIRFLREIIAIPSASGDEKRVIRRIYKEMKSIGFDSVRIDKMGNIIGKIGRGRRIIAMDAHVDTVGIGDPKAWRWDPYRGKVEKGNLYGRGAVDQKAGLAGIVYGAKFIKDFDLFSDFTLYVIGSVQEEDCEGLCWKYIMEEDKIRPDCVVITEPTGLQVYMGSKGRAEIAIEAAGRAAHASVPELGENAIYKMNRIVSEIERLNNRLKSSPLLGKGRITVTDISCTSPSLCAVPDRCSIRLDRRLNERDTRASVMREIIGAISRTGLNSRAKILNYDKPSYRGLRDLTVSYFPAWTLSPESPLLKAAQETSKAAFNRAGRPGWWRFSTNGAVTMGKYRIPTVGFGPGEERYAHTTQEYVPIEQVLKAVMWYALFPNMYVKVLQGKAFKGF